MATRALSPRRTLNADQKRERDAKYRVTVKQFGEILNNLVDVYSAINLLTAALGQAGKGAYLSFPDPDHPGSVFIFNRKHLRSAHAKFSKGILSLKNYLRVSKKKTKDPVKPESFSGTYTPVFAGPALTAFFTHSPRNFGPLHPLEDYKTGKAGDALMTHLPMVSQGYLLRNTSTMLFYIYAHANGLQDTDNAQYARSDDVMTAIFGGDIPAAFYAFKGDDGKPAKIPMAKAVELGWVEKPGINTYGVIRTTRDDFDPDRFNTYFYQNMAAANYYSKAALAADTNLAEVASALQRDDIRALMLSEHNLVKAVSAEWHAILDPERKVLRDNRKKAAKKAAMEEAKKVPKKDAKKAKQ